MTTDLIPVCVGACLCPGTPHADGDFVYLRPKLGLAAGIALQKLIVEARQSAGFDSAQLTGVLAEAYLLHGVASWDLVGPEGPIPVTAETIRYQLLEDFTRAEAAADAADDLYMGPVLAPLVKRALASLPTTPTNGSTSPAPAGGSKRPRRSKPSSTTTTPMDSTGTTSSELDGEPR